MLTLALATTATSQELSKEQMRKSLEATAMTEFGEKSFLSGQYLKAIHYMEKALTLSDEVYGARSKEGAIVRLNLSAPLHALGQLAKAERLALEAHRAAPTGLGAIWLAGILYREGKLDESEAILRDSEPLWSGNPAALNNLGMLLVARGRLADGLKLLEKALAGVANDGRGTARVLANLGEVYDQMSRPTDAERSYREARRLLAGALGEAHPEMVEILERMAQYLRKHGNKKEARTLLRQAEAIQAMSPARHTVDASMLR